MENPKKAIARLYIASGLEKLSFNGVSAMLVLYTCQQFEFSDDLSFEIFGIFNAMAFVGSLVGGWISDYSFSQRKFMIFGAILMALGFFNMAYMKTPNDNFYLTLSIISLGSGFLRVNIPNSIGLICSNTNTPRDPIYSRLYVYMNIGTLLGALLCAISGELLGWEVSFILAGIFSLFIVLVVPKATELKYIKEKDLSRLKVLASFLMIVLCLLMFYVVFKYRFLVNYFLAALILICLLLLVRTAILFKAYYKVTIFLGLLVFNMIFFALYNQESMAIILFAERNVERSINTISGILESVPVTFFQSIDPFLNIVVGLVLAWVWYKVSTKSNKSMYSVKLIIGAASVCIAFGLLLLGINYAVLGKVSMMWLLASYFCFVCSELLIIPTGISLANQLAPQKKAGLFMGVWYFSMGCAMWVATLFSKKASVKNLKLASFDSLIIYQDAFSNYAIWGFGLLVFILILSMLSKSSRNNPVII